MVRIEDMQEMVRRFSDSFTEGLGKGGGTVYSLWGLSPSDLETALYDLLVNLPEDERRPLHPHLTSLVEEIHRQGHNVLVIFSGGELHWKGTTLPVVWESVLMG